MHHTECLVPEEYACWYRERGQLADACAVLPLSILLITPGMLLITYTSSAAHRMPVLVPAPTTTTPTRRSTVSYRHSMLCLYTPQCHYDAVYSGHSS